MDACDRVNSAFALRFTVDDAQRAADTWGFSCGPAALCALLKRTPADIRHYLGDFKGYLSPTTMQDAMKRLGLNWRTTIRDRCDFPSFGLARIQFDGPWCNPGVPIPARYQHTHWVASVDGMIFDVNGAFAAWIPRVEWQEELMPWLLSQHKRATGEWWTTHALEVRNA